MAWLLQNLHFSHCSSCENIIFWVYTTEVSFTNTHGCDWEEQQFLSVLKNLKPFSEALFPDWLNGRTIDCCWPWFRMLNHGDTDTEKNLPNVCAAVVSCQNVLGDWTTPKYQCGVNLALMMEAKTTCRCSYVSCFCTTLKGWFTFCFCLYHDSFYAQCSMLRSF